MKSDIKLTRAEKLRGRIGGVALLILIALTAYVEGMPL